MTAMSKAAATLPGAALKEESTPANRGAAVALPVTRTRVQAVDILRGLVMAMMALDHTRDYLHAAAMAFQPEDLRQATPAIFMTRWITHFCAPVFMFGAGTAAFLRLERGGTRSELSRFLWTRGFWLVVLEFTVVRAGFFFEIGIDPLLLLVFWALGMSMIALALFVHLPYAVLLGLSLAMIALHNMFDGVQAARFDRFAWLWQILHAQGLLRVAEPTVILGYPLVPWIGVMAAGYCFGRVYRLPAERRRACHQTFVRDPWLAPLAGTARFETLIAHAREISDDARRAFIATGGPALLA